MTRGLIGEVGKGAVLEIALPSKDRRRRSRRRASRVRAEVAIDARILA